MEIRISDIPDGGMTIEGDIPSKEVNIHESSFFIDHPVHVHLLVEIVDDVFVARGAYSGIVTCTCDRCLKTFKKEPARSDYLFSRELDANRDETIDLTEGVVEDILLGLPLKVLCSEDCKGLCPQCGTNLNIEECACKTRPNASPFSELDKLT